MSASLHDSACPPPPLSTTPTFQPDISATPRYLLENFTHTRDPRQNHPYLDPRIVPEENPSIPPHTPDDPTRAFTPHCRSSAAISLNWVLEQEHARRCLIDYRNPEAVMAEFQHWWQIWEDAHSEMAMLADRADEGEPMVGRWLCDELLQRKRDAVGEIISALRYLEMVVRVVRGSDAVLQKKEEEEAWAGLGRAQGMWEEVMCEVVGLVVQKRRWKDWWLTVGRFKTKRGEKEGILRDAGAEQAKCEEGGRTEWGGDVMDTSV